MEEGYYTYMFIKSEYLPERGWLQNCLCCNNVTGNIYQFTIGFIRRRTMRAYVCKYCLKSKKNRDKVKMYAPRFLNPG